MFTHSITILGQPEIAVLYCDVDGGLDWYGWRLAEFLKDYTWIKEGKLSPKTAKGMSCLAAQIVAHFKRAPGEVYLLPAGYWPTVAEYIYCVSADDEGRVLLTVDSVSSNLWPTPLFHGAPEALLEQIKDKRRLFVEGVEVVAGPFETEDEAVDYRFAEKTYQPHHRVAKCWNGYYYVVDPQVRDQHYGTV